MRAMTVAHMCTQQNNGHYEGILLTTDTQEEDIGMVKAFLDSMDSSSGTNAARVIELSCNMFLLLEDELSNIKEMIQKRNYQTSNHSIADRVSDFLETLIWFKRFLCRVQTSILTQETPKALVLHKKLFSDLCNETFHVDVNDQVSSCTITSAGTGRLSDLCRRLGAVIDRKLFGCYLRRTVEGNTVIQPADVMIHSLSEILSNKELAAQKELLDLTLLTIPRSILRIEKAKVDAAAAEIVLPRLVKWKRVTFHGCIFDLEAMFNTMAWCGSTFKGEVEFNHCTLPAMLEQAEKSENIHFTSCKWA